MDHHLSSLTVESDKVANAPELDGTMLAPEWRGDNTPPEVSLLKPIKGYAEKMQVTPGHAIQVVDDSSPPEPIDVGSCEQPSDFPSSDTVIGPKSRKKRIVLGSVLFGTVLVALAIGLGVGLSGHRQGGQNDLLNTTVPDRELGKSPQSLMDDTAISAITTSDGNRHVFFQEESGRLRRALYSIEADLWEASPDPRLENLSGSNETLKAKNKTPLATALVVDDVRVSLASCLESL